MGLRTRDPSAFQAHSVWGLSRMCVLPTVLASRRRNSWSSRLSIIATLCAVAGLYSTTSAHADTIVQFDFKNFGSVQVELFDSLAPITVTNFLHYVTTASYQNTMVHRVDTGLGVIQGGGFSAVDASAIPTFPPIPLEYSLPNVRGTLGMARLGGFNTATATGQWFFNTDDNSTDLGQANGGGYAVFGQVLGNGMNVIDAIAAVHTFSFASPFSQVPLQDFTMSDFNNQVNPLPHVVVLERVSIVPEPSSWVLASLGFIGLAVWRRRRRATPAV